MLTPTEYEILARLRGQLADVARGGKAAIVGEAARTLGCSVQTVYRKLEEAGFDSQRKRRSDAGESILTEAELRLVAGVLLASMNQKGQRMPVATAIDMLHASGQLSTLVSEATVSRQLYQRRMHPAQLIQPTPSVQLRSLHPNHVWQVDSTTGAYYYLPGGRLRWMPEDEFYKNKVANLVKASSDLLTRYAATDHTSGSFKQRYYLGGETIANLLDFLVWAIWKQDDSPMHGAPFILMMDPGGANKSLVVRNFCKRLGIEPINHAAGSARVTGSVEKSHDIARMHFETRLRFVEPGDVTLDWLNARISAWAASHCSNRTHGRHGRTRFGVWMTIQAEHLRVPASVEALRECAVREPETRRVANDKTITFGSPSRTYDLTLVPGVAVGLKVTVAQNPFRAPAIDVQFIDPDTGEETWHVVEPAVHDEHGFRVDSPVIGQDMRTAAYGDVDHTRGELTRQAYRTGDGLPTLQEAARMRKQHAKAYADQVDAMADVDANPAPAFLPRRATPIALPERRVEAKRISVVEAAIELKRRLGDAYTPQVYADLNSRFPDGVPEDQIATLAAELAAPIAPAGDAGLRLIGGGAA